MHINWMSHKILYFTRGKSQKGPRIFHSLKARLHTEYICSQKKIIILEFSTDFSLVYFK